MPALVIVEIEIHNNEIYEEYKKLTPASIQSFGGRFVVRGARPSPSKVIGILSAWLSSSFQVLK